MTPEEWFARTHAGYAMGDGDIDLAFLEAMESQDRRLAYLTLEVMRLRSLINTPEMESFLEGVKRETAHQRERWGKAHDREKSAERWFWLIGYLSGKAVRAAISGDREKALHHTISSAAALANWHEAIRTDESGSGLGADRDLKSWETS